MFAGYEFIPTLDKCNLLLRCLEIGELFSSLLRAMPTMSITISEFALILGISRKTLSKILNGRGAITPDMALRLSRAFDTTPDFWLNLQKNYDLWRAEHTSTDWYRVRPLPSKLL